MLITLSRRTPIYQSVEEVSLTGVAPMGAVSHRFIIIIIIIIIIIREPTEYWMGRVKRSMMEKYATDRDLRRQKIVMG